MMFHAADMNNFEFVRVSSLRTAQLMRGCTPRVPPHGKLTTTAQREVADRKVCSLPREPRPAPLAGRGR